MKATGKVTEQPDVKRWLELADMQFAAGDNEGGSWSMWQAGRAAIIPLVKRRGWPHATDEDIVKAIRRFDAEYDDRHTVTLYFSSVDVFYHNAAIDFLEDFDIAGSRRTARTFLDEWVPRLAAL